jgi:transcriptional regulator
LYNPRWFKEDRLEVLQSEIERLSFGTLITVGKSGLFASHVPMLIDRASGERGTLFGHIARGNSQWRDTTPEQEALAVFLGPDTYITPGWYQTKKDTGEVVPTWNYIAVHVRGPVSFFDDPPRLLEIVTKLTKHHEQLSARPWEVTDAPPEYVEKELKSIVGFEVRVTGIEGKWKLSQNRPEADRRGVMKGLSERALPKDTMVLEEVERAMNRSGIKSSDSNRDETKPL